MWSFAASARAALQPWIQLNKLELMAAAAIVVGVYRLLWLERLLLPLPSVTDQPSSARENRRGRERLGWQQREKSKEEEEDCAAA